MQRATQLRQDPWDRPVRVEGRDRQNADQHVLPKMHMSPRQQQRSCSFNEGHSSRQSLHKNNKLSSSYQAPPDKNVRRSTQSFYDKSSRSSSISNVNPSPRKIPQTRRIPPSRRSIAGGMPQPQVYPDLNITPQQFNDAKAKAEAHRQQRQKRWASASCNNMSNKSNGSDTAKRSEASGRAEITSPTVERTLSSSLSALSIDDIPDHVAVVPGQQNEGSLLSIESDFSFSKPSQQYSPPSPVPKQLLSPPAPPLTTTRNQHSPPPPAPKQLGYNRQHSPPPPASRTSRSSRQHSPPPPTAKQLGYNRHHHNAAPPQPSRSPPPPPTDHQLGYNETTDNNHRSSSSLAARSAVPSALDKSSVKRLAMQHRRSFCVPDRDRASFLAGGRRPSNNTSADNPPTVTPPVSPTPRQPPGRAAGRSFCVPSRRRGSVGLASETRNTPNPDPTTTTRDPITTTTTRRPSVVSTTSHSNSSSNFSRGSSDPPVASRSGMLVTIFPGCRVPLRGSDETKKAVATDYFTTTTCFGCACEILCVSNVQYAMCPHCRVISPLEGESFEGEPRWGLGLGFTQNGLWDMQAEIAAQQFSGGY